MFRMEAVYAHHGDSLLLQYGDENDPRWVLIDGGPSATYHPHLRPRLEQLREEFDYQDEPFPLRMVMVSHVDADHIVGILELFGEQKQADDLKKPFLPYAIETLWHNSFDDIVGTETDAAAKIDELAGHVKDMTADDGTVAIAQSVAQGRDLRELAKHLGTALNQGFGGRLVKAPALGVQKVTLGKDGEALALTVVGPGEKRVEKFRKRWKKDLVKILKREAEEAEKAAKAQAYKDNSPANLASIVTLAELGGRTILLSGDARGDHVLEGLEDAGLLDADGWMHVDVLKMPHHGSDRNVEVDFFHRITADRYVCSGDGHHGNPEPATLRMIAKARGTAPYTLHFTFTEDAARPAPGDGKKVTKDKQLLARVFDWIRDEKPANCEIVFRAGEDDLSIAVDLSGPPPPAPASRAAASPGGSPAEL